MNLAMWGHLGIGAEIILALVLARYFFRSEISRVIVEFKNGKEHEK